MIELLILAGGLAIGFGVGHSEGKKAAYWDGVIKGYTMRGSGR